MHRRIALLSAAAAVSSAVALTGWTVVATSSAAAAPPPAHATGSHAETGIPTSDLTPVERGIPAADLTPTETGIPTPVTSIVTIGDSIMAGLGLDAAQAWPALLASSAQVDVTNLGCSGGGFVVDGDCGTNFAGLIDQAVAAKPDIVIIQSSDNDMGESSASIAASTSSTVKALRAALPTTVIVGFSTLWDQPSAAPYQIGASSAALQSAVAAVGGDYVDLGQPLRGRPGYLQSDDEHPTALGQQVLLASVRTALAGAGVAL